jgi:hypothetical protein
MSSAFTSLLFDVLFAICLEVDALSNRGIHKSAIVSTGQVIGRRVVANANIVPDSLLALSEVNKRLRDASEPLVFGTIKFGSKWEARGELRWAVAKSRMRGMIRKRSLRETVKCVMPCVLQCILTTLQVASLGLLTRSALGQYQSIPPPVLGPICQVNETLEPRRIHRTRFLVPRVESLSRLLASLIAPR